MYLEYIVTKTIYISLGDKNVRTALPGSTEESYANARL